MLMGKSFDSSPLNWMVGDFHNIFFIFFSSRVFPPPKIQSNRKRIDDENPIVCLVCVSKITWYKKHESSSDGNEKRIEKNKYQIEHTENGRWDEFLQMWWYDLWLSTLINFYDRFRAHVSRLSPRSRSLPHSINSVSARAESSRISPLLPLKLCDFPRRAHANYIRDIPPHHRSREITHGAEKKNNMWNYHFYAIHIFYAVQ